MAEIKKQVQSKQKLTSLLFSTILLSLCFLYLFFRVDPKLIYQSQEPVFFFDSHFMADFLTEPGGLNDVVSRFFSQFYYKTWTGTLLLLLVFSLIAWNTKQLLHKFGRKQPLLYLYWIPLIFLTAQQSDYKFPLVFTIGILWTLIFANIYVRVSPSNRVSHFFFFIILFTLLYYLAAAQAFLFTIIIIIYEVFNNRRIAWPILYAIFAAILPYIYASILFIMSIRDAYRLQLSFYDGYSVTWLSWALYAFFPIALLFKAIERKYEPVRDKKKNDLLAKIFYNPSKLQRCVQGIVFLALFVFISLTFFDQSKKSFLQIDYYARTGEWQKLLDLVKVGRSQRSIVESQAYRALYHTGRLCEKLFSYTQHFGGDGLFMHNSLFMRFPSQHSDLFFDLGLVNESEHWAYEALSVNGETVWNLQRLVLVNILEENWDVTSRYLDKLAKTIWHRSWATAYLKALSDSGTILNHPQFRYIQNVMPDSDFLVSPFEPERCLEELLQSSGNRMAFEYYMANCLLNGNIGQFVKQLYRLNELGYQKIPRHFEEAILIYIQLTGRKDINLPGRKISEETARKFADFNQILKKNDNNMDRAHIELLKKYRDTYWFYALYRFKPKEL